MGKKYIIELEDNESVYKTIIANGYPMLQVIVPAPYAEPDLEQVKKEAYEKGYETAKHECDDCPKQAYTDTLRMDVYQKGLSDAWECARKLMLDTNHNGLTNYVIEEIFGVDEEQTLINYSASECIEKIRQYEQEKQFCVGDEFETENGKRFVITKMDGTEIDRYIDGEGKTYCMIAKYKVMRKTGRHFPEIAVVLQKMKES